MRSGFVGAVVAIVLGTGAPAAPDVAQQPGSSGVRKLYPRDDSASDSSFLEFRDRLLGAARRGDRIALRPLMADVVRAYFELESADRLLQRVQPGRPWRELVEALELGTTKEDDRNGGHYFMAPYVSSYESDLDGYDELAVIGVNVCLRKAPRPDADVLRLLSHDVVSIVHELEGGVDEEPHLDSPQSWRAVRTGDGLVGYVFARYVRSPIDVRFAFEKVNGRWLLTMETGGD